MGEFYHQCQKCEKIWTETELKEKECWGEWSIWCPDCGGVVPVKHGFVRNGGIDMLRRGWKNNAERSVKDFKGQREKLLKKHGEAFSDAHGTPDTWKD